MFAIAAMIALSALATWMPYRAWRKGVITMRTLTSRRSKEPRMFAFDLVGAIAFAAICWFGTAAVIYRVLVLHSH